mmetsp:Transcript_84533/g.236619  ORF Transcript_84533/g.236619 Transcript_84533/m.236619 type:complete len:308 (+) Transcript_84533:2-925(+)
MVVWRPSEAMQEGKYKEQPQDPESRPIGAAVDDDEAEDISEPGQRQKKRPREVQVPIHFTDHGKAFTRWVTVTPHDVSDVPAVREQLQSIRKRARQSSYDEVATELAALRCQFVDRRRRAPGAADQEAKAAGATDAAAPAAWSAAKVSRAAAEAFRALGGCRAADEVTKFLPAAAHKHEAAPAMDDVAPALAAQRLSFEAEEQMAGPSHTPKRKRRVSRKSPGFEQSQEHSDVGCDESCRLSPALAKVVGGSIKSRAMAVAAVLQYIKEKKLQKGLAIRPDSVLRKVCPKESFNRMHLRAMVEAHMR